MASNNPSETGEHKRTGYLGWEDYFMGIAFLSAKRSKDPQTQVGACIVNEEKRIVGIGYNGMPNRCSDDEMPWGRKNEDELENKGLYVCHAELNAVLNKISADVKNCSMYVSLFPCNECAKIIIQAGIKDVFYYSDKYQDKTKYNASKRMFDMAGVSYRFVQSLEGSSESRGNIEMANILSKRADRRNAQRLRYKTRKTICSSSANVYMLCTILGGVNPDTDEDNLFRIRSRFRTYTNKSEVMIRV